MNIYLNSVRSPLPLRHHVQCSILPLAVPEFAVGSPNKFGAPDLAKKTARREVKFSHLMYLGRGEVQVGRRGPSGGLERFRSTGAPLLSIIFCQ